MSDSAVPADSLSRFYAEHHGWLHEWLRRKLGCRFDAADLAQDTFIRVIKARNAADVREPRSYLATIAHGLMIDLFRRRALEQAYREALAHLPETEMPSPEAQVLAFEALLEIDRVLDGLGAKVKQTFVLSQFEGLAYAEIAQRLGISLRSVNNYMARAMEQLCRLMPP